MQKLWQKDWQLNQTIEKFETAGDLVLDQQLVSFDVYGSLAHVKGLHKIGLLNTEELQSLTAGLSEVIALSKQQKFQLQAGDEDIHTKIENYLTEQCGEVGKKIHTGRSRNDQVLTAIRLFSKAQLLEIWSATFATVSALLKFAEKYKTLPMPGYTHTQKAMPSSVGMWAGSFAEALLDDLTVLQAAYALNNQSPLGSAAGYGVPLNLDRKYVSDLLSFDHLQINSLYCQNSRGKIEGVVLSSLISILHDINKFATDVVLFSSSEFGFLNVAREFCSGSSIMPQKRNVDIAELLRSKVHLVLGNYVQMISISSNLLSGYNRDLQDTKKPLFESLALTLECLQVTQLLLASLTPNQPKLEAAMTPDLYATHLALSLVQQGVPFRTAYQQAAEKYQKADFKSVVSTNSHLGGVTNLGLELLDEKAEHHLKTLTHHQSHYQNCINRLATVKGTDAKKD